uniref:Peptidase M16 N-terminal domain-containing protein n=1 Tax=Leersia perrieri TaxID=77586 RepID=A0A0D9X0K9_9ORYZ
MSAGPSPFPPTPPTTSLSRSRLTSQLLVFANLAASLTRSAHAGVGESAAAAMDSRPGEADAPPAAPSDGAVPSPAAAAANGDAEIIRPRNDKRGYRRVVLPNALECLVISDPETDKAAASMNVSVGYFCDPDGLPGLAHFLEHMLFYASEKYPIEDSYSKYIAEHGGSTNAFTSCERTNFYFDVNSDCLDDALDRFAQFFIKPLMSPDATLREINAVDSENQKNLLSDSWRMSQLQKHVCSENHPYHKFSTGNRDTLLVNPNKEGVDTLNELIKFYNSHYSANLMQLVVYGKESLDNLQTLVENTFSDVRNTGRERFSFHGHPCSSEHLQVLVKAVPIKQGHTLRILYVGHLVGHEGEGSLFYILKNLGWAMSLSAGEGDWSYEFSFFSVVIRLTDAGHEHMEDIIGLLFRYIALLQTSGTPKWIFDELQAIRETGFHYRDKSPPSHYVVNISSNMQIFPPEDWLIASSVPSKFSADLIQSILNDLTPDNVRIFWESKRFEGQTNLTEPWYGTSYSLEAVPPIIIQDWVNRAPIEDLHMQKPNIFIPSDLSLKNVEEKGSFPCMLRKTRFSRVWYKPDTMFFTPKAYIKMYFQCPLSRSSPESTVLTDMFTRLLMDYLNDYAYDAQVAGLYYAVNPNDTGFQITMIGYNDKMRILLETVIGKIAEFEVKVDRFAVIKETITKQYENFKFRQPHQQASYYCSLILEEHSWTWDEELAAISHTEASDLEKFLPHLLGKTFIESYFAGNMEPGEVKDIIQHVEYILFNAPGSLCKALPSSQHLAKRIVKLERGLRYYYPALCLNHQDGNSSLLHYIQIHQDDLKQNVLLQLLALVAKQPAFHQLRSVEQLGYITLLRQRNDSGIRGLQFIIQSTVKDPANLDERVEAFLKMFEGTLYQMPDIEFKSNVNALIGMKLEKYKNIREESAFFWREISEGTLKFDRKEAEVAALRDLKKEELIEFFNNHVKVNAPQKKILSIQVYGGLHSSEYEKIVNEEAPPNSYQITDIFSFRRSTAPTTSLAVGLAAAKAKPNLSPRPRGGLAESVHTRVGEPSPSPSVAMDSKPRDTDAPAEPSDGAVPPPPPPAAAAAAAAAAAKGDVEIIRPRNDKRGYRRVVLPNELECLLVSDPDTDKAAASMNVSVGYFCDPEGLEGLAHFLEHMLFYASEKYPIEDSYSKYISEHGGSTNAFTSCERTNFYFDVNNDCLDDALDRFAQFFIKPLMSADATLREIKAVDSENQKNLLSDPWRMSQLQNHISLESHPYHKFGTGNWNTLEVKPREKGLDTRLELIKFYNSHYSANLMQLVVYGKESLDSLQTLVEHKFCDVRNTGRERFSFPGHPCSSEHLQVLVKAVPIKQGHTLKILWPITPNIRHYKEGPCKYVSHLIGHEGEGSLFYVLKKLGWAMSLEAGEGDWSYEFSFFSVVIKLTDVGHEHMEDVVGLLFRYITLLQNSGTPKWIFDELQAICETGFHYRDKSPPIHYVVNISTSMQIYPPEDWLITSYVPSKFSPDAIQRILNELTPDNVRIFWESKQFEGQTNLTEPWYGTSYSVEAVPPSIIQKWVNKAPVEDLHMPKRNIFIPSDLSLKNVEEKASFPYMLRKTPFSRVWYKPDTMFFTPKAYIRMDFQCPLSHSSPESSVLTDIFTRLLMDYLNDYAYDAQVAGLYYAVNPNDTGFQIIMVGYNDKMNTLLETVIGKIAEFDVKVDRFSVIKETIKKEYENFKFRQPYQQAFYYCSLILEEQKWTWDEELAALSHIEASDLEKFLPHLLGKTFIENYFAGNMEPGEVKDIIQHVEDILFNAPVSLCKALPSSQHLTKRIVKLEKGLNYYYPALCLNRQDENSCLLHYIQIHQDDLKKNVLLQLLALVAKQPAFHQLRSVEQLGYIALLRQRNDSGVCGLQFIIQSTVKDPANLDARVEAFLKMFEGTLYQMPDTEFKSNVNALIDMKLEKYKNIREESAFFWGEIFEGTLKFDRKEAEVAALRDLKKEELIEFFDNHVKANAPQKRVLSIQVYGGLHSSEYEKIVHDEPQPNSCQITDIFSFRRSRPLYGSFKGGVGQMKL